MASEKKVNGHSIRLTKDDITLMDIDAFVFYARADLKLGSGIGNAIAMRGGPKIQEELDKLETAEVGDAVITSAGKLKAKHIVHAVGPSFQEHDTEGKLRETTLNALKSAEDNGAKRLALPAMGSGFYGVAPEVCARVTLGAVREYLEGKTGLDEVVFCLPDTRDMEPFQSHLGSMS